MPDTIGQSGPHGPFVDSLAEDRGPAGEDEYSEPPSCSCGVHATHSRPRLAALNDPGRRRALALAVKQLKVAEGAGGEGEADTSGGGCGSSARAMSGSLPGAPRKGLVVVLGDGPYLPFLAAAAGYRVLSLTHREEVDPELGQSEVAGSGGRSRRDGAGDNESEEEVGGEGGEGGERDKIGDSEQESEEIKKSCSGGQSSSDALASWVTHKCLDEAGLGSLFTSAAVDLSEPEEVARFFLDSQQYLIPCFSLMLKFSYYRCARRFEQLSLRWTVTRRRRNRRHKRRVRRLAA